MLDALKLRGQAAAPRDLLSAMEVIRGIECALQESSAAGTLEGPVHVSLGQEAVAVGIVNAMLPGDVLLSNHRGHGHALAWGLDPKMVVAEVIGHPAGYAGGRGGSMHIFDPPSGFLGTNGMVGSNAGVAVGAGLAIQMTRPGNAAVVIFGDGAMGAGVVYEALNLAVLWKLPIVFVCENNGYAEMTPTAIHLSSPPVERAAAFGLTSVLVDGTNVATVRQETQRALDSARAGKPAFIEAKCFRFGGHYATDPANYRPKGEDAEWREMYCPIKRLSREVGDADGDWKGRVDAVREAAHAVIRTFTP